MEEDREKNGEEVFLLFLMRDTRKRFRARQQKRERRREKDKKERQKKFSCAIEFLPRMRERET